MTADKSQSLTLDCMKTEFRLIFIGYNVDTQWNLVISCSLLHGTRSRDENVLLLKNYLFHNYLTKGKEYAHQQIFW